MEACNSPLRLHKPKAIRPSPGFHTSKSTVLITDQSHRFPSSIGLQLPALMKSKSFEPIECSPIRAVKLRDLINTDVNSKARVTLEEMAKIEDEVRSKPLWMSDNSASPKFVQQFSFSDRDNFAPPLRPSNPMVQDKQWKDAESSGSSTESDSEPDDVQQRESII